jgi:hypothetical protein
MQSKGHKKSGRKAFVAGIGSLALLATPVLFGAVTHGCNQAREGDRCNPNNATGEDECGGGLMCQIPTDCPEAYCCPPNGGKSSNAFCQPGCNGGQASICDAGGDANCNQLGDGG